MRPGLARAVPVGILGFLGGAAFVYVLRYLQGLEPVWDAQIGLVMAAFTSSAAFVWGIGGFDPRMSQHAHEPEDAEYGIVPAEAHHDEAEEPEEPLAILGYSMWQVTFWSIVLLVALFGLATIPGGPFQQQSADPNASAAAVGNEVQVPFNGPTIEASQLTVFVGWTIFTLLSLMIAGGAIARGMVYISEGATVARATPALPEGAPPADETPARSHNMRQLAPAVIGFLILFLAAFWLFTEHITGIVLEDPDWLKDLISLPLAVGAAVVLVYPLFRAMKEDAMLFRVATATGLFIFLYWLFYYILIGFVIVAVSFINVEWLRVLLSLVNAAIFALLPVFPAFLVGLAARGARAGARSLRAVASGFNR